MRKYNVIMIFLFIAMIMAGCQQQSFGPAQAPPAFEFSLPEGFGIDNETDQTCSIVHGGEIVGGLVRTNLDVDCIENGIRDAAYKKAVDAYLETYAAPPLGYEYMMSYWEGERPRIDVAFNTLDPETKERHDFRHYLFEKDETLFDMWVDSELVDEITGAQLLDTVGIR